MATTRQYTILNHLKNGMYAIRVGSGVASKAVTEILPFFPSTEPKLLSPAATWTRRMHSKRAQEETKTLKEEIVADDSASSDPEISEDLPTNKEGSCISSEHKPIHTPRRYQSNVSQRASRLYLNIVQQDEALLIIWRDGHEQLYPYVWLRDNCRCDGCYHSSAQSRSVSFPDLDVNVKPVNWKISPEWEVLQIEWEDGHVSRYESSWLCKYQFDKSAPDLTLDPEVVHWDTDLVDKLAVFELEDIASSNEALYDWINEMKTKGVALIKGGAQKEGQVRRIGDRVSFLRITEYGHTSHVKAKYQNAVNIAFTNKIFPMHVDLVFLQRPPGAQMIHCIEQAKGEGGQNWFVDGYKMALDLKEKDPEAFRILSTTELEFYDIGHDFYGKFHTKSRHTTISLDRRGRPNHVNISDHGRDSMLRVPVEEVTPLYRALKTFSNMIYDMANVYEYKLQEGDIMTFDNRRVIHGRRAFHTTSISNRHLETAYLEWDELDSRFRVLHKQLGYE